MIMHQKYFLLITYIRQPTTKVLREQDNHLSKIELQITRTSFNVEILETLSESLPLSSIILQFSKCNFKKSRTRLNEEEL